MSSTPEQGDAPVREAPTSLMNRVLIGAMLVAPFMVLQSVNRRAFGEEFPFALFVFMSLTSAGIVLALTPGLRRLRSERRLAALTLGHWAGLVAAALLVCVYAAVVLDQLPCFLGVPNCD